jgi:hypothetical protein
MQKQTITLPKVNTNDLGLFIQMIKEDYKPKNNEELADLISKEFNTVCTVEDIEEYYSLAEELSEHFNEDFELESRKQQFYQTSW